MACAKVCQRHSDYGFDCSSPDYSKNELITILALGILGLLLSGAALYGYLTDDPSRIMGSHILTGGFILTFICEGTFVFIKWMQTGKMRREIPPDRTFAGGQEGMRPIIAHGDRVDFNEAYDQIFGSKGKMVFKDCDLSLKALQEVEKIHGAYGHATFLEGNAFTFVKYKCGDIQGGIVIYQSKPGRQVWHIACYSNDPGKRRPPLESIFGYPDDIEFLRSLVQEGRAGDFELRGIKYDKSGRRNRS